MPKTSYVFFGKMELLIFMYVMPGSPEIDAIM
jgi:hypothetical protein